MVTLIFIGPQGSEKGTQAKIVSEKIGIAHISTGDLLRNVDGDLKKEVESYINFGNLVPNKLIVKILRKKILEDDCKNGFILDGFPRNIEQAHELDKLLKVDKVVEISISDDEAVKRISGRVTCKDCGKIYNKLTEPRTPDGGKCFCDGKLYQRADDNDEAVRKRLEIYHADTEPILEHYDSVKIDGEQNIEKVTKNILKALG